MGLTASGIARWSGSRQVPRPALLAPPPPRARPAPVGLPAGALVRQTAGSPTPPFLPRLHPAQICHAGGNLNGAHPDPGDPSLHALVIAETQQQLDAACRLLLKVLSPTNTTFQRVEVVPGGSVALELVIPPEWGQGESSAPAVQPGPAAAQPSPAGAAAPAEAAAADRPASPALESPRRVDALRALVCYSEASDDGASQRGSPMQAHHLVHASLAQLAVHSLWVSSGALLARIYYICFTVYIIGYYIICTNDGNI